jgi:hypothetical protein
MVPPWKYRDAFAQRAPAQYSPLSGAITATHILGLQVHIAVQLPRYCVAVSVPAVAIIASR